MATGLEERAADLDAFLEAMRADRTAAVNWPTVQGIAGELAAAAATAPGADETERTLLRYQVEDLAERLHRGLRGQS